MTWYSSGGRRTPPPPPTCRARGRLARSPPTSTLPPSTATDAADRVLKKRAAHNHLSRRTVVGAAALSVGSGIAASDGRILAFGGHRDEAHRGPDHRGQLTSIDAA